MDKKLTIKERILQFLDFKHIKKEYFYQKMNVAASNFKGNGLKSEIGSGQIVNFLSIYPEVSAEWLLTGEGDMLKIANATEEPISNSLCKECALLKTKDELIETQRKLIQSLENQMGIK